jgi:hypothetical protein
MPNGSIDGFNFSTSSDIYILDEIVQKYFKKSKTYKAEFQQNPYQIPSFEMRKIQTGRRSPEIQKGYYLCS